MVRQQDAGKKFFEVILLKCDKNFQEILESCTLHEIQDKMNNIQCLLQNIELTVNHRPVHKDCSIANDDDMKTSTDYVNHLCPDLWQTIFACLPSNNVAALLPVCKSFREWIINSEYLAQCLLLQFLKVSAFPSFCEDNITGNDMDIQCDLQLVIPIFDQLCFNQMCIFCDASLFQVYARLLSYNWRLHLIANNSDNPEDPISKIPEIYEDLQYIFYQDYDSEYKLVNVFDNIHKFQKRPLNAYERQLFEGDKSFTHKKPMDEVGGLSIAANKDVFINRMNAYFHLEKWKHILFPSKPSWNRNFFLAGGSVLSCIRVHDENHSHCMRDLDFFAISLTERAFHKQVWEIATALSELGHVVLYDYDRKTANPYDGIRQSCVRNIYVNFTANQSVVDPDIINYLEPIKVLNTIKDEAFWTQFQFIWTGAEYRDWSVLHIFDLDCSQIGFNGRDVLCTHAFVQSINTNTMINYKMTNHKLLIDSFSPRIIKYHGRGFNLITPTAFDWKCTTDDTEMTISKWDKKRNEALHKCFVRHGWISQDMYGSGGFGLNNDYFGVRKHFANLLKDKCGGVYETKFIDKVNDDDNESDEIDIGGLFFSSFGSYRNDDPEPEIVRYASTGDLKNVMEYIANGGNLDKRKRWTEVQEKYGYDKSWEWFGDSALIIAAQKGYHRIVYHLLLAGADPMLESCPYDDYYHSALKAAEAARHINGDKQTNLIILAISNVNELWKKLNPKCNESANYTKQKKKSKHYITITKEFAIDTTSNNIIKTDQLQRLIIIRTK
eukprot:72020_1